jgi:hypothetical protein
MAPVLFMSKILRVAPMMHTAGCYVTHYGVDRSRPKDDELGGLGRDRLKVSDE